MELERTPLGPHFRPNPGRGKPHPDMEHQEPCPKPSCNPRYMQNTLGAPLEHHVMSTLAPLLEHWSAPLIPHLGARNPGNTGLELPWHWVPCPPLNWNAPSKNLHPYIPDMGKGKAQTHLSTENPTSNLQKGKPKPT